MKDDKKKKAKGPKVEAKPVRPAPRSKITIVDLDPADADLIRGGSTSKWQDANEVG